MATVNEKKFELKIGKSGILVVILGMAGLLCAAFLFGVDVGQNMEVYPGKIASLPERALALVWRPARVKLAQQNTTEIPGGEKTVTAGAGQNVSSAPADESIDLTYHKTLTSKDGLTREDSFAAGKPLHAAPGMDQDIQQGKFHIDTQPQTPVEKTPLQENAPAKEKEAVKQKAEEGAPTDVSEKTKGKSKYIVQVASLKDKATAYQMNKKIAALGFESKVIKTEIKGKGTLYRVVASNLSDKDHALQAAKKISGKTGSNCIVKKIEAPVKKN